MSIIKLETPAEAENLYDTIFNKSKKGLSKAEKKSIAKDLQHTIEVNQRYLSDVLTVISNIPLNEHGEPVVHNSIPAEEIEKDMDALKRIRDDRSYIVKVLQDTLKIVQP